MAISKTQLETNALEIKNETNPGENSATRVGSFAEDINNSTIGHFVPTSIELAALVATSSFNTYTLYVISAVGGTKTLECRALTAGPTTLVARDLETGEVGIYTIGTDTFAVVAPAVAWGSITGDITDQTDVGARKDAAGNVFIGLDNTGNTLTGTTSNNLFFINANLNDLDNSIANTFYAAQSNILVDSNGNTFGVAASSCELDTVIDTRIGNYCLFLKLFKTSGCIFEDAVIFFDNTTFVGATFQFAIIKEGLDFSTVSFSSATQLFGRLAHWSINKVLGTDLIEVTFDCNLPTASTGVYATDTNTFTAYSALKDFKITLLEADIVAAGSFDIADLPAVSGCYWNIENVQFNYTFGTVAFDGGARVIIGINTAGTYQYTDVNYILALTGNDMGRFLSAESQSGSVESNIAVNRKAQVTINTPSTVGDGTLTIYGTARLVKI